MNDDENTVNEEEELTDEEYGNKCVLLFESIYKKCIKEANGDKVVAAQLYEKLISEDEGYDIILKAALSYFISLEDREKIVSFQILNELIEEKLITDADAETIVKDARLRIDLIKYAKIAKSPSFIFGDNTDH